MSFMEMRQDQLRRREAAAEIFVSLDAFEKDLGRTLASGSHLVGQLHLARVKANVSPVIGHDAIDHFVMALGHITQALGAAVEGHHSLEETRRAMRLPEMAGGDKDIIPSVVQPAGQLAQDARTVAR
ncbi:MAG: hypothetical protein JHD35_24910 [Sphingopyxis sp.]|nr:hypothetical protein [Sphingopyxis sp.]